MSNVFDLEIDIDLKERFYFPVSCKQNDDINLIFNVYNNSVAVDLNNFTYRLRALKSDLKPLIQRNNVSSNKNIITIVLDKQLTAVNGLVQAELQLIDKTTNLKKHSFNIAIRVISSVLEVDRTISKATYDLLTELEYNLDKVDGIEINWDRAEELNTSLIAQNNSATSNISKLKIENDKAPTNMNNLKIENDRADINIPALKNENDNATEKLDEFRLYDKTNLIQQVQDNTTQLNENVQSIKDINNNINSLNVNKAEKSDLEIVNTKISNLDLNKANKTDITSPFNYKGACLFADLPSTASLNDTWYLTDKLYRVTWNGSAWYQSSLEESKYTDKINEISEKLVNAGIVKITLEQGDISTTDGSDVNSYWAVRSDYIAVNNQNINIKLINSNGYYFRIYKYNVDKTLEYSFKLNSGVNLYFKDGYIRINITADSGIKPLLSDISKLFITTEKITSAVLNTEYAPGSISATTGEDEASNITFRSNIVDIEEGWYEIEKKNLDYQLNLYLYDDEVSFSRRILDIKDRIYLNAGKIRLLIKRYDNANIDCSCIGSVILKKYNKQNSKLYLTTKWEQGSLSIATGLEEVLVKTLRTDYIKFDQYSAINIDMPEGYQIRLYNYSVNKSYIGASDYIGSDKCDKIYVDQGYVRFLIKRVDFEEISANEADGIVISIANSIRLNKMLQNDKNNLLIENMIKNNIMNGTTISPIKNLNTIVGHTDVDEIGNIYVGYEACDSTAFESADDAYASLLIFNIARPQDVEVYSVVVAGEELSYTNPFFGYKETVTKAWDTLAIKINENTVRVITKIFTNTTAQYQVYKDFNLKTKTFGELNVMSIKNGNNNVVLWGNNNATLRKVFNLTEMDTSLDDYSILLNCRIEKVNLDGVLWYYTNFSFGYHTHALIRSKDLITWEFISEIPIGYSTEEVQVNYYNNKLYCVNRGKWNQKDDVYVTEFNLSTSLWERKLALYKEIHGQERPCTVVYGNYMYVAICDGRDQVINGSSLPRTRRRFYKVNLDTMAQEKQILVSPNMPCVYPEFILVGASIYMIANTDRRGYYKQCSDGRQELSLSYFNHNLLDLVED